MEIVKFECIHNEDSPDRTVVWVKDCEENYAGERLYGEAFEKTLRKTGKGLIVVLKKKNTQEIHYELFPRYDANSSLCIACEEKYRLADRQGKLGKHKMGFAIASPILGMTAIMFTSITIGTAGVISAVISLLRHEHQKGAVIAGIILSCIGIGLGFVTL